MQIQNKIKIILSHPTGNANLRAVLEAFEEGGILHSFHTTIATFSGNLWSRLSKLPGMKDFGRRIYTDAVRTKTYSYPFKELMRMLLSKLSLKNLIQTDKAPFSVFSIYKELDKSVAHFIERNPDSNAVYAYEDGALLSFRSAKNRGKLCLYDLPIGYWRSMHELLEVEKTKNPDWAVTLGGFSDSPEKLKQKDEELRIADRIYVASTFTKKTLEKYPSKLAPIEIIPYGFPTVNQNRKYKPLENRKLKVLYVGGLSQRKGISYLFQAIDAIEEQVELTVVGRGSIDKCPALANALSKHCYIPSLPHAKVLSLMATQDVLVFPSLFEGFGMVITEAMSQGTPVITTNRTCGPDVINHGLNGWIVEAGNGQALQDQLQQIIDNPGSCEKTGRAALETAAKRPWSQYGYELLVSIRKYAK